MVLAAVLVKLHSRLTMLQFCYLKCIIFGKPVKYPAHLENSTIPRVLLSISDLPATLNLIFNKVTHMKRIDICVQDRNM